MMVKVSIGLLMLGVGIGFMFLLADKMTPEILMLLLGVGIGVVASMPATFILLRVVRNSTIAEMDIKSELRAPAAPPPGYGAQPNIIMVPGMMPGAQPQAPKGGIIPQGTFQTLSEHTWG